MDTTHTSPCPYAARIARVLALIDAQMATDLNLDRLAEEAALSRFQFSRVFRAQMGEGVAEAVRRRRLNRAALLVVGTRDTLEKIAIQCGFGHVGSFERAFSRAFGQTALVTRNAAVIPPPLLPPERGKFTVFPTEIRTSEELVLAGMPHIGAYQDIGDTFARLVQELMTHDLWTGSGPSIGLYYDDPSEVPISELRAHACQRLAKKAEVPESLDQVTVPGGDYLVLTCKGPFTKLPEAWNYLYAKALPESGRELRHSVPYERYITNSWETRPEDYITEVWVPIH